MADENETKAPFTAPMMTSLGSSVLYLTNPDKELEKTELTFRSKRKNEKGELISIGDPKMNELGISSVMGQIQSVVSQVTIMTDLKRDEIESLVELFVDALATTLMVNRKKFGISSYSVRNEIFFIALISAFICMKRAENGGERRFLKGSVHEIKQQVESMQRTGSNRGFLSKLWS